MSSAAAVGSQEDPDVADVVVQLSPSQKGSSILSPSTPTPHGLYDSTQSAGGSASFAASSTTENKQPLLADTDGASEDPVHERPSSVEAARDGAPTAKSVPDERPSHNLHCVLLTFAFFVCAVAGFAVLAKLLWFPEPSNPQHAHLCPKDLPSAIENVLKSPLLEGAYIGVLVRAMDNGTSGEPQSFTTLYAHNERGFFTPASNNKVMTTSAALLYLGPQFRYHTQLTGVVSNGEVANLTVVAGADPSLATADLIGAAKTLASTHGIQRVRCVAVDDSLFTAPDFPVSWEYEDLSAYYGAPPASSIVNENTVSVRVTPAANIGDPPVVQWTTPADALAVPVENSAVTVEHGTPGASVSVGYRRGSNKLYVTGSLSQGSSASATLATLSAQRHMWAHVVHALQQNNITVAQMEPCTPVAGAPRLASVTSAPFVDLLNHTLQYSDNLYAETFLRTLGAFYNGSSYQPPGGAGEACYGRGCSTKGQAGLQTTMTTQQRGVNAVRSIQSSHGLASSALYSQVDGSGLSRHNLLSPQALVETLSGFVFDSLYISCLPVGGQSGTLKYRFVGTPAAGIVHAKTGTMSNVNALSGFVLHPSYSPVVFSVLVNLSPHSSHVIRPVIDQIVVLLAQLRAC